MVKIISYLCHMKNLIVVDVESDGPIQGINSMVCFGAVIVEDGLERTVYGKLTPISETYNPEALAVSGLSREEHEQFDEPKEVMEAFDKWISDNTPYFEHNQRNLYEISKSIKLQHHKILKKLLLN